MEKKNDFSFSKWHVFHLYPRSERVVKNNLIGMGYDVFLPTVKVLKTWRNRQKKWIEQVLFPGYIFVNIPRNKLYDIVKLPKVLTFISCAGIPSVISEEEIICMKKVLSSEADILVEKDFRIGERVRVTSGPLLGCEGILVKQQGKHRFGINLKDVNHSIFIDISENLLEATTVHLK